MLKLRIFNMNDAQITETPPFPGKDLDWWMIEVKHQIHDPINVAKHPAGFEVLEQVGESWMRLLPRNPQTRYDIREIGEPVVRIESLLDKIKLYLDPEKYTFDYIKVEQLLTEAQQVVEHTARGVRPKDLPADIPFSDSLDEEGRSDPYVYKGDMSPEDYDRMMDNFERDRHTVVVYQSPDGKHCALQQQDNYGTPDKTTGIVGKRYVLPKGISVPEDCNGYPQLQNDDDLEQEVYIDNDKNGVPAVHLVYKDDGGSYQDIIPMKVYVENIRLQQNQEPKQVVLKIKTFVNKGQYSGDTGPFDQSRLDWWISAVESSTCNTRSDDQGFEVFQWDSDEQIWHPYKPDGKETIYTFYNKPDGTIGSHRSQPPDSIKDRLQDRIESATSKTAVVSKKEPTVSFGEMQL